MKIPGHSGHTFWQFMVGKGILVLSLWSMKAWPCSIREFYGIHIIKVLIPGYAVLYDMLAYHIISLLAPILRMSILVFYII